MEFTSTARTHLCPREDIESRGEVSKGFTAGVLHKPVHLNEIQHGRQMMFIFFL